MAGDLYLKSYNLGFMWVEGKQSSAGATDAGKLVALNASGLIASVLIDAGLIHGITVGQGGGDLATNTALGVDALLGNTTGLRNTALGWRAGRAITSGNDLTAVGQQALPVATGAGNTGVGSNAGLLVVAGINTTLVGHNAGAAMTSASGCVAIGASSGQVAAINNNCVYIGQNTTTGSNGSSNEIVIGQGVIGSGSNQTTIGNSAMTYTRTFGVHVHARAVNTVATLPVAAVSTYGRSVVADATQTLTAGIGAIVAGGGANTVPVFCDGTNWRIG